MIMIKRVDVFYLSYVKQYSHKNVENHDISTQRVRFQTLHSTSQIKWT